MVMNNYNADLIIRAFNTNVFDPNWTDVQQTPVYDTVTIAAAAAVTTATASWFTNVGGASGKTAAQTNVGQPKRLAAPESFSVQAIRFRWSELILLADAIAITNNFVLDFRIGTKSYQQTPLWMFGAGGGVYGAGAAATTVAATTINTATVHNGVPSGDTICKLDLPLVLLNQVDFFAQLIGTSTITLTAGASGGTGAIMMLVLDGYYSRGIQ